MPLGTPSGNWYGRHFPYPAYYGTVAYPPALGGHPIPMIVPAVPPALGGAPIRPDPAGTAPTRLRFEIPKAAPAGKDRTAATPPSTQPDSTAKTRNRARIHLVLPNAEAEAWVEGEQVSGGGTLRVFEAVDLQSGKPNLYTVTASWSQDGKVVKQERTISISPGTAAIVDFTKPAPSGSGKQGSP
jgi:uncharacterized protein (TIGR03000 family)